MTFEVTDREEQHHGSTTWVRCNDCGTTDRIEDARSVEDAVDEAERIHAHVQTCVACLEPMPADQLDMLACLACHEDAPEETLAAVNAAFGAMTHDQRMTYLERSLAHARATIGKVA